MILLAGVLLAFPGFVTDLVAVLLLVPVSRPLVRRPLERALARVAVVMPGGERPVVRGEVVD